MGTCNRNEFSPRGHMVQKSKQTTTGHAFTQYIKLRITYKIVNNLRNRGDNRREDITLIPLALQMKSPLG